MSNSGEIVLVGLQEALLDTENVDQFLDQLASLSARLVDEGMSCGMALRQRGRPLATGCSDPLASRLDNVQLDEDDGPSLQALRCREVVRIDDMSGHRRWRRFARAAISAGVHSALALPLTPTGEPVGVVALYARQAGAFGPEVTRRADRFAAYASGSLTLALRMASCSELTDQLRSSMMSRAIIDQALGVIMARERVPQDRAFAMLRQASQNSNVKLRDLAAMIVTGATGAPPQPSAPFED